MQGGLQKPPLSWSQLVLSLLHSNPNIVMGYNEQSQIFVSMNDPVEDLFGLFITKIIYQSYFLFGFGFLGKC